MVAKVKDLKWGVDVKKGDNIPLEPHSDGLTFITESLFKEFQKQYGEKTMIIDRSQPWFSVFTVVDFVESRKRYAKNKMRTLEEWGTKE